MLFSRDVGSSGTALRQGVVGGLAWAVVSCGSGEDRTQLTGAVEPDVGTLSIPLDTVGSSGALYRLSASLRLTGPVEETLLLSGAVPVVEAQLPVGSYEALLLDPFRLSRIDADGPRRVDAVLVSDNPATPRIDPGATTQLVLRFRVQGGDVVPPEDGTLVVTLDVDDGPPAGDACVDGSAGPCLDDLLDTALAAAGSGAVCLPAQTVPTPLGNLPICEASVCADGSSGCSGDLAIAASTQVLSGGSVEVVASVSLRSPLQVPVRLPPILGGGTCRLGIQAALSDLRASLDTLAGADGRVSLRVGDVTTGSLDIDVVDGGSVCGLLGGALPLDVATSLEPLIARAVSDRLSAIVEPLSCTECAAGCALRCAEL